MSNIRPAFTLLALFLGTLLVFTTGACGGAGATTTQSLPTLTVQPSLSGPYGLSAWFGDVNGPTGASQWGTVTGNGFGGIVTLTNVFVNQGGVVQGPANQLNLTYDVSAGNAIAMTNGGLTVSGGIASNSSLALMATSSANDDPAIVALGRRGEGFSNASLTGDYHFAGFFLIGGSETAWFDGTATFDGNGNCTAWSAASNNNGNVAAAGAPVALGTYSVGADGIMVWNNPAGPWEGGIYGGGDIAILTGSTQNGVDLQIVVALIKRGAGQNVATFSGTYQAVGLTASNNPPPRYASTSTTIDADGAGMWSFGDMTQNTDGVMSVIPAPNAALPYAVAADGRLDLVGGQLVGAVSPDGRYGFFAGASAANSNPQIWLMVR